MEKAFSEGEAEGPEIEPLKDSINKPHEEEELVVMLKPLLHGCLTGQFHALFNYSTGSLFALFAQSIGGGDPQVQKLLPVYKKINLMSLRLNMLWGVTTSTASIGLFELLSNRVQAKKDGEPLSLYQEACIGLTCGMMAASVWQPVALSASLSPANCLSYRKLFGDIYRIVRKEGGLALWKGRGLYVGADTATFMGMLTSYNRSLNYLMESRGLSKTRAQISASIISGLSASVCYQSFLHLNAVKSVALQKYNVGIKDAYKDIPLQLARILAPGGVFKFYTSILTDFGRRAPSYMVQWWIFEKVRSLE